MSQNYYEILEVDKNATIDEIKKSYRKLSMKYHPDKNNGDKEAEEKFKTIAEAWATLSDPDKKERYDDKLNGKTPHQMFRDEFFGQPQFVGESIAVYVPLTLEEIYSGVEKNIKYERGVLCNGCGGNGSRFGKSMRACSACGGSGEQTTTVGHFSFRMECGHCGGNGKFIADICPDCNGQGLKKEVAEISFKFPPGVYEKWNKKIIGGGHECRISGGRPGDAFIVVKEEPHPIFKRDEHNLVYRLKLAFPDAYFGTKVQIPTLDGDVTFDVPPRTPVGKLFRVDGKGMPILVAKGHFGHLLVVATIDMPENISENDEKLLEELRKSTNFTSKESVRDKETTK